MIRSIFTASVAVACLTLSPALAATSGPIEVSGSIGSLNLFLGAGTLPEVVPTILARPARNRIERLLEQLQEDITGYECEWEDTTVTYTDLFGRERTRTISKCVPQS